MSGFSLLLREKIEGYRNAFFAEKVIKLSDAINRVEQELEILKGIKLRKIHMCRASEGKLLRYLFNNLDFNKIDQMYDDNLRTRTNGVIDPIFESVQRDVQFIFCDKVLIYCHPVDKINFGRIPILTEQELKILCRIFGKRLLAACDTVIKYKHCASTFKSTYIFIDYKVVPSSDFDCTKFLQENPNRSFISIAPRKLDFNHFGWNS